MPFHVKMVFLIPQQKRRLSREHVYVYMSQMIGLHGSTPIPGPCAGMSYACQTGCSNT